jgi:hypothetical protein
MSRQSARRANVTGFTSSLLAATKRWIRARNIDNMLQPPGSLSSSGAEIVVFLCCNGGQNSQNTRGPRQFELLLNYYRRHCDSGLG